MADAAAVPEEMSGSGISDATPPADKQPAAPTPPAKPPAAAAKDGAEQTPPGAPGPEGVPPNETAGIVKSALNIKNLDPHLEEMLRIAQLRLTQDKTGLLIDMPQNGHSIHCGKSKEGVEFIGMPNKKMVVDEHDAHVMVGLAKGRGWKSINVNGNSKEQELLWLEAMRQGLNVSNFQPDPGSAVFQTWQKEFAEAPQLSITEAKEDFHVKSMQLLQEKATAAQDKDVKAGLETILKKFQEGTEVQGTAETHKQLTALLSDKDERSGYNLAVEFLNKAEPKLALAKLDPVAAAPVATPAATKTAPKAEPVAPG